jgi:phage-related protein
MVRASRLAPACPAADLSLLLQGSIISAIAGAIEAVISAIASVVMAIIGGIASVCLSPFSFMFPRSLSCRS